MNHSFAEFHCYQQIQSFLITPYIAYCVINVEECQFLTDMKNHPFYLPFVFIQYFSPFLFLLLSHFTTSIPHVFNCLSLFIAHSAPSLPSFHLIPVFSLFVPTSKSRHHSSFSWHSLSKISSVIHLSYFLLYLSLLSCLSVSSSLSLSSTFIHPLLLIFPRLHWHTRFSSISLSPSSPCFFSFLSSITLVSCTLPFDPFCLQILPLSFPLSLSAYSLHSSLTT
jgi:hypothetical protein